jgi:nicotinamide mononucleotide transporter
MSCLSVIALLTGVLGVWLTIKQNIWCWPLALISVIASFVEFYKQRLFGDMALQVFYFFAGVYGWYFWKINQKNSFEITKIKNKQIPFFILITVLQAVVYYYLLIYFKSDKVLFDAILTACSLTATYMMTKKWVENWLLWVFIDTAYVVLYFSKLMWAFALLYGIFALVAYYGWKKWKTIL